LKQNNRASPKDTGDEQERNAVRRFDDLGRLNCYLIESGESGRFVGNLLAPQTSPSRLRSKGRTGPFEVKCDLLVRLEEPPMNARNNRFVTKRLIEERKKPRSTKQKVHGARLKHADERLDIRLETKQGGYR
jgi:hypothetical protein